MIMILKIHLFLCLFFIQSKTEDYLPDPGYEYPPEPEILFSKYKRNGDDDVENGDDDDDDDFDDIKSDNKNNKNTNGRKTESSTKFNIKAGKFHFLNDLIHLKEKNA